MALDLGTITSAVVLRDAFTGVLDKVIDGIGEFEDIAKKAFPEAAEFLEALGPAFGIASAAVVATTAAVTGLVAATAALGERGADVMDVSGTLEHFSGSAEAATETLDKMRAGVHGTVDDMALMKDASRLLSAGVKLNADDFGTMGEAAFVLQNRGLGGTKEMMDLVSDAMVTGRTRALAMKLGVVDLGDAQANFAKTLGIEATQLSDAGKAEAARVQVMKMLNSAVADAGNQQLDFGEKVEKAEAQFSNWLDSLAVAVTQSPVLTAAIDTLGQAWSDAFGGSNQDLIQTVVHFIEQGLIHVTDFGLGVIEFARVAHTAFEATKSAVLLFATAISTVVTGLADIAEGALNLAASVPGATQGMKDAAASATGFRESVEQTTISLADQQEEAHKAAEGQDAFNQTLDAAGGFLFKLRDTMVDASHKTVDYKTATDDTTEAIKRGTKANQENTASFIDQTKMQDLQKKGLAEATKLWHEYDQLIETESGTSFDAQAAAVRRWKDDLIAQHKEAHTDTKEFYDAIEADAKEKLSLIGSHWSELADQSRESLKAQAEAAKADYERMRESGLHFTQDTLDAQMKKWLDLQDAANGFGKSGTDAMKKTGDETDKTTQKIKTLAGEMISLEEMERRRAQGGSTDVTSQNFEQALHNVITSGGWNPSGAGSNIDMVEAFRFAKQGYSFAEILDIFNQRKSGGSGPIPPPHGPRIPGFAGGGVVMVGENGPELAQLPNGTRIFPHGSPASSGINITMYVNGSARDVANEIKRILINDQMLRGRIPV